MAEKSQHWFNLKECCARKFDLLLYYDWLLAGRFEIWEKNDRGF